MFLNLKYHIATLAAIFLALGLGILIGSTVPGGDSMVNSRQQMADRLESQFYLMKQNNDSLKARLGALEMDSSIQRQFGKQVLPMLVGGKLKGHNIAIIDIYGYAFPDELVNTLKAAGAEIQSVTVMGSLDLNGVDERKIIGSLAEDLVKAVVTGEKSAIEALSGGNLLKVSGQYGQMLSDVILIGGSRDKSHVLTESFDFRIIDCFRLNNIPVYGVEESNVAYSYMADYQKKRITTVDNIDTVPGQVSLIYAVAGRPGQYGIKATAKTLMPIVEYGVN